MVLAAQFDVARAATSEEHKAAAEALEALVAATRAASVHADEPDAVLRTVVVADLAELCCDTLAQLPPSFDELASMFASTLRAVAAERLAGKRRTR